MRKVSAALGSGERRRRAWTVKVFRVDFYQSRTARFAVVNSRFFGRDEERSQGDPAQLAKQAFPLDGGWCPDSVWVAAPSATQIERDQGLAVIARGGTGARNVRDA